MDHNFTAEIKRWLDTDPQDRDIAKGAMLLLRLNANRILYANIMRNPAAYADIVEAQLQKQYDFRSLRLTHEQVADMERQAVAIAQDQRLDIPAKNTEHKADESFDQEGEGPAMLGRREDHDDLPDEIKALYTENYSILQRMRELHLQLRSLTLVDHPCPDSERYPFLRDLIAYDKKLRANWKAYDTYALKNEPRK